MLSIGNVNLRYPFFQAPISGYSDMAMRRVSRRYGAQLAFNGLMLDKSVLHEGVLDRPPYCRGEDERPLGGQLLGSDPYVMCRAAKRLEQCGYDIIDLNFACPAPKVIVKNRGGYLLSKPILALEIFKRVRDAVKCPVTVKMRIGYKGKGDDNIVDSNELDNKYGEFFELCGELAAAGADALVIHGRTVSQRYKGRANWLVTERVKRLFPEAKVLGSGDLHTAKDVVDRLNDTKLDGVVLARGAIGNPWIFEQAAALLDGKCLSRPSLQEQAEVMYWHFDMLNGMYSAWKALILFRKFCVYYCRLHPERKSLQQQLLAAKNAEEFRRVMQAYYGV